MTKNSQPKHTPLISQFLKIKKEQPDALLLFRMGDFYETFFDDAKRASKILGITLTTRDKNKATGVPLAGFPYHALDTYLKKLLDNGIKVAICEQVEDPKKTKKLVKRKIVEVITPGTILEDNYLNSSNNNFLTSIFPENDKWGIASIDISTGEFSCTEINAKNLIDELVRIHPSEILIPENQISNIEKRMRGFYNPVFTEYESWRFDFVEAENILKQHFAVASLDGFGLKSNYLAISAAASVLSYIQGLKGDENNHLTNITFYSAENSLQVDSISRHNLELIKSIQTKEKSGTLLDAINKTNTPMGNRLLQHWLLNPLIEKHKIEQRLNAVEELLNNEQIKNAIIEIISEIGDMERIIGKVGSKKVYPRDLNALKEYLQFAHPLADILKIVKSELLCDLHNSIQNFDEVVLLIDNAICDEAPPTITAGGIFKENYNNELDELRSISKNGKSWIAKLESEEREKTKIERLKIKFNNVFGYFIEISNRQTDKVPESYIRKQTLVNSERYITPELKEYENKVLGAEERIKQIEHSLFNDIREKMIKFINRMQKFTTIIAKLDVLTNFAQLAYYNNYVKPTISNDTEIIIKDARHPVVEKLISEEEFIPNDIYLNNKSDRILLITGPNMAGKSTYLRQVGLIVIMAHIGCYIPASKATISITDKIFTRVGASDNLALGQSTFLVEMIETANILHNATPRSLILLDEVGRGTSTFDGLSIAWAVVEYLHENQKIAAKTLFATHYHELTELADLFDGVKNYNITVNEWKDKIIFLRKVLPGAADQSYGIQVAKLAGIPNKVIERAKEILSELEKNELTTTNKVERTKRKLKTNIQTDFLDYLSNKASEKNDILEKLHKVDINNLSPLEALNFLSEIKKKL
ncbi:MAG: DNA mismatch repair protein MutS [Candidatus Cloacimonadota bacterium]|nr:DNA mismatch repair protein MutS [Candidatus Cloacimonadota bacterium]